MTRFWITLEQAVELVLDRLDRIGGGETFVPRIPSMRIVDIAEALAPGCERRTIGIRPGEKLHEALVTEDEARHTAQTDFGFVILPEYASWQVRDHGPLGSFPDGFRYASDTNDEWLSVAELRSLGEALAGAV